MTSSYSTTDHKNHSYVKIKTNFTEIILLLRENYNHTKKKKKKKKKGVKNKDNFKNLNGYVNLGN